MREIAVGVEAAHVAGRKKPSAVNSSAFFLRHAPVAGEHVRAAHLDVADGRRRHGRPSSSTTRTSTPGSAGPTEPARRSPFQGLDVSIPVSVMP